jgi:hypothetical protein
MATIGIDCEVIIDGTGYFVKPATYTMQQPRIRKATTRADGGEAYVDLGPGKRRWSMVILCFNDLTCYDGTPTTFSGQQYRDALRTSYSTSTGSTILLRDPLNAAAIPVHFDQYTEQIMDLHSQVIALATGGMAGASYEVAIELLEA